MKFSKILRGIFEAVSPGGVIYSDDGLPIQVSRNGTTFIDPRDMQAHYQQMLKNTGLDKDRPSP